MDKCMWEAGGGERAIHEWIHRPSMGRMRQRARWMSGMSPARRVRDKRGQEMEDPHESQRTKPGTQDINNLPIRRIGLNSMRSTSGAKQGAPLDFSMSRAHIAPTKVRREEAM